MAASTGSYFSYSSLILIGVVLSFVSSPISLKQNVTLGNKKISRVSARKDKFNPTFLHQATDFFIFLLLKILTEGILG